MMLTVPVVFRFSTAGTEQGTDWFGLELDVRARGRQGLVVDARFTGRGTLSKLAYKILILFAAVQHACIYGLPC
jgi:hypothetical protein